MMKVKYKGPDIGIDGLKNEGIYEVIGIEKVIGALRIIDESGEDYLYHPKYPRGAADIYKGGRFEIVSDPDGLLAKQIYG